MRSYPPIEILSLNLSLGFTVLQKLANACWWKNIPVYKPTASPSADPNMTPRNLSITVNDTNGCKVRKTLHSAISFSLGNDLVRIVLGLSFEGSCVVSVAISPLLCTFATSDSKGIKSEANLVFRKPTLNGACDRYPPRRFVEYLI